MGALLSGLWGRFSTWILGALALLAAVAGVYLKGRSAGKKVEQAKEAQEDLAAERAKSETIQQAHDVASEVAQMPASEVQRELRDEWSRD